MINWTYQGEEIKNVEDLPEGTIGFVYKITNLSNGKFYFGKKSIFTRRKKKLTIKEKQLPENKRKTFKFEVKENPWQKYTGSCKTLNEDIRQGATYTKEIIKCCTSKIQMTVLEMKYIFCSECLEIDMCYNENILGKFFPAHFKD